MDLKKSEQIVQLHPASYRHLNEGHPYILPDQYTEKFRAKARFLIAEDHKSQKTHILLNDTAHPKVKARLWKTINQDQTSPEDDFLGELRERIENSFNKRLDLLTEGRRENIFLSFGEADYLPGLFILKLGEGLIIQAYARYWRKFQKELMPILKELKEELPLGVQWISWQEREDSKTALLQPLLGKMPEETVIEEWGVRYKIKLTQGYDLGIYTDMAALRERLKGSFQGRSFLNLYSYTGAWSLFALKQGAIQVSSSDLSGKYLDWLDENLELNEFQGTHERLEGDNNSTLRELIKEGRTFDIILCDPPSFSSDKKKTTSALKAYETTLPLLAELCKKGGQCICFLNTHSVAWKKFESQMRDISNNLNLKVEGKLKLEKDCPVLKGFPEGNYLKGIILKKV